MNRSGQALAEYVMLLAIVVMIYAALIKRLGQSQSFDAFKKPFVEQYRYTYRYGHPDARGYDDDGAPKYIPQYSDAGGPGGENFRIFINPTKNP